MYVCTCKSSQFTNEDPPLDISRDLSSRDPALFIQFACPVDNTPLILPNGFHRDASRSIVNTRDKFYSYNFSETRSTSSTESSCIFFRCICSSFVTSMFSRERTSFIFSMNHFVECSANASSIHTFRFTKRHISSRDSSWSRGDS